MRKEATVPYWSPLPEELGGAQRRLVSELRSLKDANQLTVRQIGRMTHYSHASWERWLNGKRPITWQALDSLVTALDVQAAPLRELFDAAAASGAPGPAHPGGRTPADLPGAQTSALTALAQLPADTRVFTGRENEVARLTALVRDLTAADDGATVIVALDGMAGVGKSALAVRVAHLLADRFPDGQLFLDLHGHTRDLPPLDPADALACLLTSLQVPPGQIPAGPDARAAALRARLAGTRTLILLDNAATEAQVRPLIPGNGGCLVLITSRRRLKALDEAHTLALDVLPRLDAIALLQTLVGPERASAQDARWLEIADLCGCLPLALRIAAALLRHRPAWTLRHLVVKLRAAPLEPGSFTDGERDLSAVFNLSYQTLDDARRVLLRRLGLAPGPDIDAPAAAALLDTDQARAERLLQSLVDHHLLSEPAADRYRMHDLVRAYAHAQAVAVDAGPERDQALGRLLNYYAHTAQSASHAISRHTRRQPSGPSPARRPDLRDPEIAHTWLRTEYANLDAAFTHVHAHDLDSHIVALAAGLAEILRIDGPWSRALEVHRTAAKAAEHLDQPDAYANALADLGHMLYMTGDYSGAVDALSQALASCQLIGHRNGEANALTDLGRVMYATGDIPGAVDVLARALAIYRDLGHRNGEANALTSLGDVKYQMGDHPGAVDVHTRALAIYRDLGHRNGEANALVNLGRILSATGDYPGATDNFTRALAIHREIGERRNEAWALNHYAAAIDATGDRTRAVELYRKALIMNRELNKPDDEAISLEGIADHHLAFGETVEAARHLHQALEIYRRLGMGTDARRVQLRLADLASPRGSVT
jgi:tetratricopeptide (TPR) repeat protein